MAGPLTQIPEPYYLKPERPVTAAHPGIKKVLMGGILKSYEEDKFDCSEMAAYIEWKLENNGIDAKICTAKNFSGKGFGHAWVAVDLPHSKRCFIETTMMSGTVGVPKYAIIRGNDRDMQEYNDYSNYDNIFEDIYEMVKYARSAEEVDWWNDVDFGNLSRSIYKK
jgi:hypothetical protein